MDAPAAASEVVSGRVRETLRLRRDATLIRTETTDRVILRHASRATECRLKSPAAVEVLDRLSADEEDESDLLSVADDSLREPLSRMIATLEQSGWIERTVLQGERRLATAVPRGGAGTPHGESTPTPSTWRLSRFAVLHCLDDAIVLESPRSTMRVILHEPVLGHLALMLATGKRGTVDGLSQDAQSALINLLGRGRILADPNEDADQRLAQWSLPDLLFHQRSRRGRHSEPYGGTFHLAPRFPIPPVLKPVAHRDVMLRRVALDVVTTSDAPLQRVIEARRSLRDHHDATPIDVRNLGEFLFRAASAREPGSGGAYDIHRRPYPGGGAMYELEIYPIVRLCNGLAPGVYHYDPGGHSLASIGSATDPAYRRLLANARMSAGVERDPQIVLVIAARVGRMMWKYESMAYAAVLKHVGVLMHQFYLVATAMGLAPCALGGGDAEAFAQATGTDPYEEPSVGEFMLGSAALPALAPGR